ncbi:hypothetical protein COH20_006458 [Aspergillus flavus]|nr:hypothetical protein COH21_011105 [Aspergillus flavus]RAQ69382.1 hypothetical protein COH20_006458 [Aspergillus flavus]
MVRVAVAGGTGNVSKEIVSILGESGKHEIVVFTRSDPTKHSMKGVQFVQVDYNNKEDLKKNLKRIHTVLCFIWDTSLQMSLIDCCIEAGVRRFAPNEWAARCNAGIFQYADKDIVHAYLQKVIEYCLFQPGLFMNYLSSPIPSTTHHAIYTNMWDVANRRAIVPADSDYRLTLTTIQDLARVVDEALGFEDEWPEVGGITGSSTTSSEIIRIAESIRGPFVIERVSKENLEAGKLATSWTPMLPEFPHLNFDMDWAVFSEQVIAEIMKGGLQGAWDVSDEWNKLLPDLKLTTLGEFLTRYWKSPS